MHVAAKAVQLGDGYVAPEFSCGGQGGFELRPAVQRVRALPGFDLHKLPGNVEALCVGEVAQGLPLGLNPQTGASLLGSRNSDIRDKRFVGHAPRSLHKVCIGTIWAIRFWTTHVLESQGFWFPWARMQSSVSDPPGSS